MSNVKHTAGPWDLAKVYTSRKKEYLPVVKRSEKVVYTVAIITPLQFKTTEEDRANAKLIAAAPELLETLVCLKDEIIKSCPVGSDPRLFPLFKMVQEANAAIKKATE